MLPLHLIATGVGQPDELLSSRELDCRLGHAPGHVEGRSGVVSRRFAAPEQTQSELAAAAAVAALTAADLPAATIDLLISVSGVPEQALPTMAAAVARHLPLAAGTPAFDVGGSCLGFLNALQVAGSLLNGGIYRRILLVASDLASRGVDWDEPGASLIFGDGAAAVILERGDVHDGRGLRSCRLETYPEGYSYCEIRAGGTRRNPRAGATAHDYLFRMDGKAVFRLAARTVPPLVERVLADASLTRADLDLVVPHQASHLAMRHLGHRLGFASERIVDIYATQGNQVSASLPCALHAALADGRARPGSRLLLLGTGAGFTAGAAVLAL